MNPFEDEGGILKLERRLGAVVARFRTLAEGMRDLPLYNPVVAVEAVDFLPFGSMGFGVLVTPWFMSALFLPLDSMPYDPRRVGTARAVPLPAGERSFQLGGDDALGLFWAHSLLSPLPGFEAHEAAVDHARYELARLLTPPEPPAAKLSTRRTIFTAPRGTA